MRLFVSVRPTDEVVAHLCAELSGRSTSRPDQWHITLAFLGEVNKAEVLYDGLRAAAARTSPFRLNLAGGGVFTGARVVWAGVGGDGDELTALESRVREACCEAGVVLERRGFRPHVTVGKIGRVDAAALSGYVGPTWEVDEFELVHSALGRTATHTVLERFALYQA